MSHNQLKVNTKSPNIDGDITVNLSDIITVNTPTSGELLQKAASDWNTAKLPPTGAAGLLNNFDLTASGNINYKYSYDDCYISRKVGFEYNIISGLTLVNSTGIYVPVPTGSWAMGYYFSSAEFPSGSKVLLRAIVAPFRFSGSNLTVQFFKGPHTQSLSNSVAIGQKAYSTQAFGATAFGLYESTGSNEYVTIRVVNVTSNNVAITSGYVASIQQITAKQLA